MAAAAGVQTPKALYRHLLRKLQVLPAGARDHYKHRIRQEFNTYSDESDPERVQQIIEGAVKDVDWIVNQHSNPTTR